MVKLPLYSSCLSNLYWMLRHYRDRDKAARRRYYRRIEDEKKRLFLEGVDKKEVLLLCRYLSEPRNIHAKSAFLAYAAQYRLDL